jgi:hypothetical protein
LASAMGFKGKEKIKKERGKKREREKKKDGLL